MKKKVIIKKLKLNKATIIKLNQRSMESLMGGKNQIISYFSCLGGCDPSEVYNVAVDMAFKSCCKGTCN
jgi:natural product precursor